MKVQSFAPVANRQATKLILGSMPGAASLKAGEYYAHPRNAFWIVMEGVVGIPRSLSYVERTALLREKGFALWDVLHACTRTSSLDSDIVPETMVSNDLSSFLVSTPLVRQIYFNGATAETIYLRHIYPSLSVAHREIPRIRLPSTSPANARLNMEAKLAAWSAIADE